MGLLDETERTIQAAGPETVAMLIAEPVQNAGGCLVPPEGYWPGLRALCDKYGIALVADEVITGFGRIGEFFASSRFGSFTVRTPFFSSALTFSPSVPSGSVNARLKLPYERSLV